MPTLIGNAAKPNGAGGTETWTSSWNMAAERLTMPERGRVVSVGIWSSGVNQTSTAYLAVWDGSTGAQLGESAALTLANGGAGGPGGDVFLYVAELVTPVELDAGVEFLAGFWRAGSRSHHLQGRSTGAHLDKDNASRLSFAAPRNSGGHGFGDYSVGIHAYYEPIAGAWVRRSGAWVRATDVQVRRSGAWADVDAVQVRRSGSWNDAD